ncbi:VTC domain-containing protein [Flaviflexus equikiangi]
MTDNWAAALPGISLDDLNRAAARLSRVDRKYLVREGDVAGILAELSDARVLDVDGCRSTRYASLYCDTPQLDAFHLAGLCRRRRFKVRTRSYEAGDEFLEVKWKDGRGVTHKVRQPLCGPITSPPSQRFVETSLENAGIRCAVNTLEPVLQTGYARTTLLLPGDEARATIDSDLAWTSATGSARVNGMSIIETKAGSRLTSLDLILHRHRYRALPMSKYGVGMVVTRPGLPAEKWHRTLRLLESTIS